MGPKFHDQGSSPGDRWKTQRHAGREAGQVQPRDQAGHGMPASPGSCERQGRFSARASREAGACDTLVSDSGPRLSETKCLLFQVSFRPLLKQSWETNTRW